MATFYKAFDLVIESDCVIVHLPEIPAQDANITVKYGQVEPPVVTDSLNYYWGEPNRFVFQIDEVGRFLVENGSCITIEKIEGCANATLSTFLMGSAIGALLHQRGLLVLHANAVVKDDLVTIFAGESGAGKSTMAAFAMSQGYQILGDDVCAIYFDEDDKPWVLPAYPSIKLWQDAISLFEQQEKALMPVAAQMNKYHIPVSQLFCREPKQLNQMVVLNKSTSLFELSREKGIAKFEAVADQTYRKSYLDVMDLAIGHLSLSAKLVKHIAIWQAQYPHDHHCKQMLIDLISSKQKTGEVV